MRRKRSSRYKQKKLNLVLISFTMLFLYGSSFYVSYSLTGNGGKPASENSKQDVVLEAPSKPAKQEDVKPIEEPKKPVLNEVVISSTGDSTLGWDDKFSYYGSLGQIFEKNNKDFSYFYKNVSSIFKADDITTTNLETTFTTASAKASKEYNFKAPPEFVQALSLGYIEGVNISNNHIRDYLDQGFNDTVSTLKKGKINYFGEGEKWLTTVKGHNFGFLGYKGFSYDSTYLKNLKADIQALKSQKAIVIINFHWGEEGSNYPTNIQKYLAHYAIDNGADLIIGHHPHVIQGIESYKGKIIAYSLGNFCFGGNKNPPDKDTFILQTKFNFEEEKLKSYGIKVIPCNVSSVSNLNDYCPTPLEGAKKEEFFKKLKKFSPGLNFEFKDEFFLIDVNN